MSDKLTVEVQNNDTGIWEERESFKLADYAYGPEVKKKFLFWEYTSRDVIPNEEGKKQTRIEARIQAENYLKTNSGVRIRFCEEACDEDGGGWFPPSWKRIIWKNGEWL